MLRPNTLALTATLAFLTALGPLATDMYLPSLPAIGRLLGASTAEVQLTLSVFLCGFAVGQIIYGPLSDRHGRKPVLIATLVLFAAASAVCAAAPTIETLIAARFLQALAGSGPVVLARSVVRDLYEGARAGRELSLMGMILGVVPTAAPILGGGVQATLGWRANFVLPVLAGLVLALVVWRRLPETLRQRAPERISPRAMLEIYAGLTRHGAFRAYLALTTLTYAGLFAWISASSFVLQDLYGLSEFAFGIAFALACLGYVLGALTATRLILRLGLDRTVGYGVTCLAGGGMLMVLTLASGFGSAVTLVATMTVYLFGVGLGFQASIAGALTPFPDRAGAASSLVGFTQMTLAALVGIAVGHALGESAWPLAATVALMGVSALAVWAATRKVRCAGVPEKART